MFKISKNTKYALIILAYLSKQKKITSIQDIICRTCLPKDYIKKVMQKLVEKKILKSKEGINGGYTLARKINKIFLSEIISIYNEQNMSKQCNNKSCKISKMCYLLAKANCFILQSVYKTLHKITLSDILKNAKN